jgi:large subunit ribosomal protein L30
MADTDQSSRVDAGSGSASPEIEITQVRSPIGAQRAQRRTLRALGLRRIHQTVSQPDRAEIHGMLAKVAHLVEVRRPGDDQPMGLEPGQEPQPEDEEQRS